MVRVFAACLLLLCASLVPAQAKPVRILFVGNELVDVADIPGRFARLARAMGKEVAIESAAFPGYALEDHWRDERTRSAIAKGWDFVVLQQGPSAMADERHQLVDYAKRFAAPIRAGGAKPALFMAWPRSDHKRDFPAAIAAWRAAAQSVDGVLLPVAESWLRVLSKNKRAPLYAGASNASSVGSDLAVLTTWFALFPAGPREFDEAYVDRLAKALDLDQERRDLYIDAATRAIDEPMTLK